jgi:hypothetical protein
VAFLFFRFFILSVKQIFLLKINLSRKEIRAAQHFIKMKNMKPIPQNTAPTCWVTAYKMTFDRKGKPKDTIPTLLKKLRLFNNW